MKKVDEEMIDYNDLKELDIELADILLSRTISSEIVELPIIKMLSVIWEIGKSVKEYLFKKKLIAFLIEINDIDLEKKDRYLKKIKDNKLYEKTGISLLEILDSLDSVDKAKLVGKLYLHVIENEVESDIFFRCTYLIDRCYYDDILELKKFKAQEKIMSKNKLMREEILDNLYGVGFLKISGYDGGGFKDDDDEGTVFMLNFYGELIIKIL